ncbi:cytochrome P450 [Mycobacterium sp. 1245805.9]|uniref:cytochrome P450 n=1 Tax=Mycobacterium sp. 1245805.9 TaxID=1856862 RepID=UPI0007FE2930|nr:cytochrome P450 [Mycobacterium sp. 1245805.9]OBI81558.1 cytochrome [Mycobacterium sp. 1245805.9]
MNADVKTRVHWLLGYGLPRWTLKLLARRGDPFSQLLIDGGAPADVYRLVERIRERGRLSAIVGGWVTADAQIVRDVLRDDRFRTSKPRDRSPFPVIQRMLAKTNPGVLNGVEPPSLLVADPPEHARLRRLVSRAFTPRAIEGLRQGIQDIVDTLLDDLEGTNQCDLIAAYASQIPIAVIVEMLGISRDETTRLQAFAEPGTKILNSTSPSWREYRTSIVALREFETYLAVHIERLRRSGGDGSILSAVLEDGDLTETEVRMFAGLLLGAGFITTTHAFGNAVVALVGHRDQLAHLQEHPEGWANAVEEVLRYDSVAHIAARVATETVEIDGHTLQEGAAIFLLIGGANRDPAVFERPNEFDTTRANAREHIAFGSGIHSCLGASLARMELQIGLQALFERFPQLALTGEPVPNDSTLLRGIKELPVDLGHATVAR